MKVKKKSFPRTMLAGSLLLLLWFVVGGCEKATLGDGMANGGSAYDFHGAGWAEEGGHGLAFLADTASCDPCHGEALSGGVSEVSCSSCHPGWEGDCTFCHGFRENPEGMSGWHGVHLRLNQFGCEACHGGVVDAQGVFRDRALHINGVSDVDLASGFYDDNTKTCSTSCHETVAAWSEGNHPEEWADPTEHGYAFFHDRDSCQTCHGALLGGGNAGVSCDSCHTSGTPAWRTDCTFCHGGIDNSSGAPPEGVYGETARASAAVGAHTAHVEETDTHAAYDCTMCHIEPTSIDDPNHIDLSNGAEMQFGLLAGAGAIYSPSTAQCTSVYCHGDGRTPSGQVGWTVDLQIDCTSCHGYTTNAGALSGDHRRHANEGIRCSSCHAAVVDDSGRIINRGLHTNGEKNVSFSRGGVYNPATRSCSSINCHDTKRW